MSVQFIQQISGWAESCGDSLLPLVIPELQASIQKHQELYEVMTAAYTQVLSLCTPVMSRYCLSVPGTVSLYCLCVPGTVFLYWLSLLSLCTWHCLSTVSVPGTVSLYCLCVPGTVSLLALSTVSVYLVLSLFTGSLLSPCTW